MKLGLIISGVIVVVVLVLLLVLGRMPPDPPTKTTTAAGALDKVELPTTLPQLYKPESPNTLADTAYKSAVTFAKENSKALSGKNPTPGLVFRLSSFVLDGLDAGQISAGLFDGQVPMTLGEHPEFGDAMLTIAQVVLKRAEDVAKTDKAAGTKLALGTIVMGERLYRANVRLSIRIAGVAMMRGGIETLYNADLLDQLPNGGKEIDPWIGAVKAIKSNWDPKIAIVTSVQPHMGDLINIARNDKDLTYRVEAVRWMGIAKFLAKNHKGNLGAIEDVIAESKTSSEPMIAAAAQSAEALTHEQFKRLR